MAVAKRMKGRGFIHQQSNTAGVARSKGKERAKRQRSGQGQLSSGCWASVHAVKGGGAGPLGRAVEAYSDYACTANSSGRAATRKLVQPSSVAEPARH